MKSKYGYNLVPEIGEYYLVERLHSNRKEVVEIMYEPESRPSYGANAGEKFYGETIIKLSADAPRVCSTWSQNYADFEKFINHTSEVFHFTLISKEQNPEYWL